MLNDTISPKTYRLLNLTTDNVPSLTSIKCQSGMERLKYTLESDTHKAFGTYIKYGSATSVQCLDGELSARQRNGVADLITKTTDLQEVTGYYFIHDGDEPGLDIYSHYFISL